MGHILVKNLLYAQHSHPPDSLQDRRVTSYDPEPAITKEPLYHQMSILCAGALPIVTWWTSTCAHFCRMQDVGHLVFIVEPSGISLLTATHYFLLDQNCFRERLSVQSMPPSGSGHRWQQYLTDFADILFVADHLIRTWRYHTSRLELCSGSISMLPTHRLSRLLPYGEESSSLAFSSQPQLLVWTLTFQAEIRKSEGMG